MTASDNSQFSPAAFRATREKLRDYIDTTPLVRSDWLSEETGSEAYLKLESFQKTHSFKVRGAFGALLPKLDEARRQGVVTGSSGNFAQGLAYAGRALDVPVTVVMLERSAANKVEAARRLGAEIVFCEDEFSIRTETVDRICREQGKLLIHSFDDAGTILGNGSIGLELLEQLPDVDIILTPASGGGVLSGVSAVVKQSSPECRIFGVQPEVNPSMKLSLQHGAPTEVQGEPSIADGLIATRPGELPFKLVRKFVEEVLLVSETEIAGGVKSLLEEEKLIIEPSGAVGVAALRKYFRGKFPGKTVAVVLTGGNLDPARLPGLLAMADGSGSGTGR